LNGLLGLFCPYFSFKVILTFLYVMQVNEAMLAGIANLSKVKLSWAA
jgi:hypothetical protein